MSKPASSAQQFVDESTMLRVNHIPAVARMCHGLGLIDLINESIPRNTDVDLGTLVTGMVADILTFILLVSLMIWNLMQKELRRSEQAGTGQLKDLNKRSTKRPTSYLLMCHLSGIIILKHGNARHLPRNGIKPQGLHYLKALGFDETIYTAPPSPRKTQRRP